MPRRRTRSRSRARSASPSSAVPPPDPATQRIQVEPLRKGLRELGWVEGKNLVIAFRWAEGKLERLPALLDELMRLEPDVLMTTSPRPAMLAKAATQTIAIVAVAVDDPVQMGLVASITLGWAG